MKLYYSPDLHDLLSNIDNEISKFLISLYDSYPNSDINLLDIDKENVGCLTFSKNSNKLNINLGNIRYSYIDRHYIWTSSRNSIKIGKFIQRFQKFSNKEIEDFVNLFKSSIQVNNETIELVSGEDIRKWYLESNYYSYNGNLGASCMRKEECQEYFDIYTKNPDTCKLLIVKRNNKLVARALVWKISKVKAMVNEDNIYSSLNYNMNNLLSNREYIMDKCYFLTDHYKNIMENYANKNNWIIKTNYEYKLYNSEEKKYKEYYLKFEVKVNSLEFEKYPYMDTFTRYNSKKGILFNDQNELKIGHILNSTHGSYRKSITKWEYIKLYISNYI